MAYNLKMNSLIYPVVGVKFPIADKCARSAGFVMIYSQYHFLPAFIQYAVDLQPGMTLCAHTHDQRVSDDAKCEFRNNACDVLHEYVLKAV